jgi:hypothetical protein
MRKQASGLNSAGIIFLGGRNCHTENTYVTRCASGGINFKAFGTAGALGITLRNCRLADNTGGCGIVVTSGTGNIGNTIATNNRMGLIALPGTTDPFSNPSF